MTAHYCPCGHEHLLASDARTPTTTVYLPDPANDETLTMSGYDWWRYRAAIEAEARAEPEGLDVAAYPTTDAEKLRMLATWFDHFDDWREATKRIAPGISDYRDVQNDLRRMADAIEDEARAPLDTVFTGPHNGCTYERAHVHPEDSPEEAEYLAEARAPLDFDRLVKAAFTVAVDFDEYGFASALDALEDDLRVALMFAYAEADHD